MKKFNGVHCKTNRIAPTVWEFQPYALASDSKFQRVSVSRVSAVKVKFSTATRRAFGNFFSAYSIFSILLMAQYTPVVLYVNYLPKGQGIPYSSLLFPAVAGVLSRT